MGLKEIQFTEKMKPVVDDAVNKAKGKLKEIGLEMDWQVDWDSFATNERIKFVAGTVIPGFTNKLVNEGKKSEAITQHLKDGVKVIIFTHKEGQDHSFSLDGNTLTCTADYNKSPLPTDGELWKFLETKL